jgi:imidazolonepropionase-like amidohydrolase
MSKNNMIAFVSILTIIVPFYVHSAVTAYVGATLINGTGNEPVENSVILVSDDRIIQAGSASLIQIPANAKLEDINGKFIIPGFVDTHVHFFESGRIFMHPLALAAQSLVTKESEEKWVKDRFEFTLQRYLCSGVTSLVSLGGPLHIESGVQQLASSVDLAPRVLVSGAIISNDDLDWLFDGAPIANEVKSKDEIRNLVLQRVKEGADVIKLAHVTQMLANPSNRMKEFSSIIKAGVEEAHKHGLRVFVHVEDVESANALLDTGLDVLVHLPGDKLLTDSFVSKIVENNIAIQPTLGLRVRPVTFYSGMKSLLEIDKKCGDPEVYSTFRNFEYLETQNKLLTAANDRLDKSKNYLGNLQKLFEAGAKVIVGSDSSNIGMPHGVGFQVELQMLEKYGMQPAEIIKAATKNAAEVLGIESKLGTVENGKQADFLILNRNPLETIRNAQYIDSIVHGGKRVSHEDLRVQE